MASVLVHDTQSPPHPLLATCDNPQASLAGEEPLGGCRGELAPSVSTRPDSLPSLAGTKRRHRPRPLDITLDEPDEAASSAVSMAKAAARTPGTYITSKAPVSIFTFDRCPNCFSRMRPSDVSIIGSALGKCNQCDWYAKRRCPSCSVSMTSFEAKWVAEGRACLNCRYRHRRTELKRNAQAMAAESELGPS